MPTNSKDISNKKLPYILLAVVCLVTEAAYMSFELVAQRVMSPWFGNSNIIWTAIIGIILASGAIGNWLGGKLADSKLRTFYFILVLLVSSFLCAAVPTLKDIILPWVSSFHFDLRLGASIATLLLFFAPSCAMGFLVPMLIASSIEDIENAGNSTGKMYAISTVGGIIGTFICGFWLIPTFASVQIIYFLAFLFSFCAVLFVPYVRQHKIVVVILSVGLSLLNVAGIAVSSNVKSFDVLGVDSYEQDTQYSKIIVHESKHDITGEPIRVFNVGGGYESVTYISEDKKYEPVSPYILFYDNIYKANPDIRNILMIGGAGYCYPKHLISTYPDKRMDVVEIDPEVTEIAKEYFFLQDLIDEYDTDKTDRLNLITDDGRMFLNNCEDQEYDAILNDAFTGDTPPVSLCTQEAIREIKRCLKPDGIYATNVIAPEVEGSEAEFAIAEIKTISSVFKYVRVLECNPDKTGYSSGNFMVIASDGELPEYDESVDYFFDNKDSIVFTDEYAPVEKMSYHKRG